MTDLLRSWEKEGDCITEMDNEGEDVLEVDDRISMGINGFL